MSTRLRRNPVAKRRPSPPRITITDQPDELHIVIPCRRSLFVIFFLGFWVCGWAVGEVMAPIQFLEATPQPGEEWLILAWFVVWTVGGVLAIYAWLWQVMGKETVTVRGTIFSTRREIRGFGFGKDYDLMQINDVRLGQEKFDPMDITSALQLWGIGGGVIAFESAGKTRRFGTGLDEAEAKQVMEALKRRLRIAERPPA